jgi:antirestriction protein ArdC
MSTPYKPLSEQIANKMILDLKSNVSIFQRPENNANSAMPFNLESGNRYPGASALTLLMQKRDDPRWATFDQANRNRTAVNLGAAGTYINFKTRYEYQKMFKNGEPVLNKSGKQRFERVRLPEPKDVVVKVFNAEQMRKMTDWEKEPALLSPSERVDMILDNSKVALEHGGDDMLYDKASDTIVIPEKEQFASPEQYAAEALHQLVHREIGSALEDQGMVKEELTANLASLFLSKELNLPYELNYHEGYVNSWAQVLKEEPGELFKAAADAQKIMDKIMGYEQQREEKQDVEKGAQTGADVVQEQQTGTAAEQAQDTPRVNPDKLTKGEIIPHNGTEFKVISVLKNNEYNMQDLGDKRKFKMSAESGLFASLIEARNNSQEISTGMEEDVEEQESYEVGEEEQIDNGYQMQR